MNPQLLPESNLRHLANRCEQVLQLGGIRTGTLDYPNPLGGQSCRVAHIDTGSGLRVLVLLDRGGDLGEASFKESNLAYLTQNGYKPPSHAYPQGNEWLASWPGGLLTTGGRGLALIRAYMTRVEYSENGCCVTLEKVLG